MTLTPEAQKLHKIRPNKIYQIRIFLLYPLKKWPVSGWRQLDPDTGDEAGTTEGDFEARLNLGRGYIFGIG